MAFESTCTSMSIKILDKAGERDNRSDYAIIEKESLFFFFTLNDFSLLRKYNLVSTQQQSISCTGACVNYIHEWMLQNKLLLNDSKTDLLLIAYI